MKYDLRPLGLMLTLGVVAVLAAPPAMGRIAIDPYITLSGHYGQGNVALSDQEPYIRVRDGDDDEEDFMGHRWNPTIALFPPSVEGGRDMRTSPPSAVPAPGPIAAPTNRPMIEDPVTPATPAPKSRDRLVAPVSLALTVAPQYHGHGHHRGGWGHGGWGGWGDDD